jgi:putative endonuclease
VVVPSRPRSLANQARGRYGERRAAEWYAARGYTVVDRNWHDGPRGELDLVAERGETVVFAEVKARSGDAYGTGAEAVTPLKQARLRRLGAAWLAAHPRPAGGRVTVRFDVVVVTGASVEVIEDAF